MRNRLTVERVIGLDSWEQTFELAPSSRADVHFPPMSAANRSRYPNPTIFIRDVRGNEVNFGEGLGELRRAEVVRQINDYLGVPTA